MRSKARSATEADEQKQGGTSQQRRLQRRRLERFEQDSIRRQIAIKISCPILLFLLLDHLYLNRGHYNDNNNTNHQVNRNLALLGPPPHLFNYADFQERFPRNENLWAESEEDSSRQLLFIDNLLRLAKHNLRFLLSLEEYQVKQSYFTADRTLTEQQDTLGQLDQLNLTKIWARNEDRIGHGIDGRVSGINRLESRREPLIGSADVELKNPLNRWWMRKTKGQSHFQIPDFPLNEQPDPERITHIDADLRACTDDIQDQKDCGACYAFSWNSFAQWHYCRQSGEQIDFSEQHIIDCGYVARLDGCVAGLLPNVREFSHTFGFELEKDYPYKGKLGSCKKGKYSPQAGSVNVKTVDFKRIVVDRAEWEEILKEQPILAEVHLPLDIMSYNRGVHPGHNCDKSIAHGMILVGHGRQAGVPYWLLKNSMGVNWGENGYLRISRDSNMNQCFQTGFVSKFKFQQLDEEKFYQFYDTLTFEPTKQPEKKQQATIN